MTAPSFIQPNAAAPPHIRRLIVFGWLVAAMAAWFSVPSARIPSPAEVLTAAAALWGDGLAAAVITSYSVNLTALAWATVVSLTIAYATVLPVFRPVGKLVSTLRFNGFTGLPFMLGSVVTDSHDLKITLLTIGMTLFFVTSMVEVVSTVPKEKLDHARTLGLSEWGVVWEVVILGTRDQTIELLRQNAAMGWMMLSMVEGLYRGEGGIGVMMLNQSKYLNMGAVVALQATVLLVGLAQDFGITLLKAILCPYAALRTEKR